MDEAARRLEIARLLANADQLIGRGKVQRGLNELWTAEALACGSPNEIRTVLDFTLAAEQRVKPRQRSRFGWLITALEHDASRATESATTPLPPRSAKTAGREAFATVILVLILLAGLFLIVVGIVLLVTAGPGPGNFDFTDLEIEAGVICVLLGLGLAVPSAVTLRRLDAAAAEQDSATPPRP